MGRVEPKAAQRRKPILESLPFTKTNYQILGAALLAIALGYVALSQPPWDGTMPLVVAPILLVLGYCVLVPLGILYRKKATPQTPQQTPAAKS
jgi:hypothetical protein